MEIIEKQVEKVKEVPADGCYGYGYSFDVMAAKQNQDAFNLYKSQRDADDDIRKELSDLKAQVAINAAVRPYQDKLIQCEIDGDL